MLWFAVKVGIPEFLNGIGKGVESHVAKLDSEIGDFQKLLVTRTLKLKKLGIPCKHVSLFPLVHLYALLFFYRVYLHYYNLQVHMLIGSSPWIEWVLTYITCTLNRVSFASFRLSIFIFSFLFLSPSLYYRPVNDLILAKFCTICEQGSF